MQSQVRFKRVPEKVPGEGSRKPWCKAKSGVNSVLEKVPEKVPAKVWEALVQSRVRFNRARREGSGEGLGGFGANQVKFNRVPEKVPEKVPGCKAKSGSAGSVEGFGEGLGGLTGSGEGLGSFGAEPGQVQQEVPEKVPGSLGAKPSQLQQGSGVPEKVPEKVPGSLGAKPSQVQRVP